MPRNAHIQPQDNGPLPDRMVPVALAPAPRPRDEHLADILDDALGFVNEDRGDVAITCLIHAVHVAYGVRSVPAGLRAQLNAILHAGGGFS